MSLLYNDSLGVGTITAMTSVISLISILCTSLTLTSGLSSQPIAFKYETVHDTDQFIATFKHLIM